MNYQPTPAALLANGFEAPDADAPSFYNLELDNGCTLAVDATGKMEGLLLYGPMSFFPDKVFTMKDEAEFVLGVTQLVASAQGPMPAAPAPGAANDAHL